MTKKERDLLRYMIHMDELWLEQHGTKKESVESGMNMFMRGRVAGLKAFMDEVIYKQ